MERRSRSCNVDEAYDCLFDSDDEDQRNILEDSDTSLRGKRKRRR